MNLIPWRPKGLERAGESVDNALVRFRGEVENLFDRFFRDAWGTSALESLPARFGWGPRMDLAESENDVVVKVELPGIDPKNVEIDVTGTVLTIRGEKKQEKEERKRDYHYVEREYGSFSRSVQLPASVDPNQVDAAYKDGLLTVTLGKRPEAKPKRITVRHA